MKIATVVHGRFHAFDLTRALIERNHNVVLFTNYPKWIVEKWGIDPKKVRSFWRHYLLSRFSWPEARLHKMFGKWAAGHLIREPWDVVLSWSGISKEIFQALNRSKTLKILVRGSAHIRIQKRLLEEESIRTGLQIDQPSSWIIEREEEEYRLADTIRVLSTFSYQTFLEAGVSKEKLFLNPSGTPFQRFRPSADIIEARRKRILSKQPLRALFIGSVSFRKGLWDMAAIMQCLKGKFNFQFVGPILSEAKKFVKSLYGLAKFYPKVSQNKLHLYYEQGDLFIFPTVEDGFPQVLAQAQSNALPILTTTNCSGPDMIQEGKTGWVLPIRNPEALIERLQWCDSHREELAKMVQEIYENYKPRDWLDVAMDFEELCKENLEKNGS